MKTFFAYILSNASRTLYVGFTNDLERRGSRIARCAVVRPRLIGDDAHHAG